MEQERKFLIRKPSEEVINNLGVREIFVIRQFYLVSTDEYERRIRIRKRDGHEPEYFYTEKKHVSFGVREENERKISRQEFLEYLYCVDFSRQPISKTRYVFDFRGNTFEIDIYDLESDFAILEVELYDINMNIDLPNLQIIRDVTGEKGFSNGEISKTGKLPKE